MPHGRAVGMGKWIGKSGKTMEFMGKLGNPQENGASTGKSWDKLGNIWKTCGDDANDME